MRKCHTYLESIDAADEAEIRVVVVRHRAQCNLEKKKFRNSQLMMMKSLN